jgi:hypothetical protein
MNAVRDFLADRKVRENRMDESERIARAADRCIAWMALGFALFVLGVVR